MGRRRFYAPPSQVDRSAITLSSDETHHLTHVLRLKAGDEVFVFDGCGQEYRCALLAVTGKQAQLEIIERLADEVESPAAVTLAQALAKGEKFDLVVQKATELGVSRIVPLITEHTDVKPDADRSSKRAERYKRISLEAVKQCGRRRLVEIEAPVMLREFLSAEERGHLIVFSERGGRAITQALADAGQAATVTALVGPEGGWSKAELDLLAERGAKLVTLGPRILRAETAAIVAVTLIQHAIGDLSSSAE